MDREHILALERPHPRLWRLYVIRSILAGPLFFVVFPVLLFRYQTLRYGFDDQGIHMRWGVFFRREVNLTYKRIQDIHVRSGFIQRWLGLADLLVQTASGSAGPEMTIEGFREFEQIRDFLYARMRGIRDTEDTSRQAVADSGESTLTARGADPVAETLRAVVAEIAGLRRDLEKSRSTPDPPS